MSKTSHDSPADEKRPARGRSRRKTTDEAPPPTSEAAEEATAAAEAAEQERPAKKATARRRSAPAKGAASSKAATSQGATPEAAEPAEASTPPSADNGAASEATATPEQRPRAGGNARVVVVGPDGRPMVMPAVATKAPATTAEGEAAAEEQRTTAGLVDQPTKVIRIGSMIKQLLEEVRTAPLDEAARVRLTEVHARAVHELEDGLSGDLLAELRRLTLPLGEEGMVPSDAELRIAQAQLVGWLEGLFQSIQTALVAQQVASQSQRKALPPGLVPMSQPPQGAGQGQQPSSDTRPGQYL